MRRLCPLLCVVLACATPQPPLSSPPRRAEAVERRGAPSREVVAPPRDARRKQKLFSHPAVDEATRPARLIPTEATACELHVRYAGMEPLGLRFAVEKPPYAWVHHAAVSLLVPTSATPRQGFVVAESETLTLSGVVAMKDVAVHPSAPLVLAGFVMPKADASLEIAAADAKGVRVRYRIGQTDDLIVVPLVPLESTLGCSDITLDNPWFNAWTALERTSWNAALLARGTTLHTSPSGPAVARIQVRSKSLVPVFDTQPGWVRIAIDTPSAVIAGWVSVRALDPTPPDMLGSITTLGHGAGTGTGRGFGPVRSARCSRDVPLVVEQAGERRTVGSVHAGTSIDLDQRRDDGVEFDSPASDFGRPDGTTWLVLAGDLDGCELRGPGEKPFNFEHHPLPWPRGPRR